MKKWIIAILVVVLVGGGLGALQWQKGARKHPTTSPKASATVSTPVKADPSIRADGKVVPVRSVSISAQTGGLVNSVRVRDGQTVKTGQLVVKLDQSRQNVALIQAEAQYMRAKARVDELLAGPRTAEVASAEVSLQTAKARLARVREQGAPVDIAVAEAEAKAAQAQLDLVKAGTRPETLAAAKADLASAEASLKQARLNLADTEIKAPFTGTVAAVKANEGESIGNGAVLMRVFDTTNWQVETSDLTEMAIVRVHEGDRATISFDALKGTQLPGRVVRINPLGENRSGDIVYTAVIALDRQDARLRWNMTATVKIQPTDS